MKRLIASRKLQRKCIHCKCSFKNGDIYYKERTVYADGVDVFANEHLYCPKCLYKEKCQRERLERFKLNCTHPITDEIWDYIPGEAVMQPDHTECRLCYAIV
jgi:hypothetical protein